MRLVSKLSLLFVLASAASSYAAEQVNVVKAEPTRQKQLHNSKQEQAFILQLAAKSKVALKAELMQKNNLLSASSVSASSLQSQQQVILTQQQSVAKKLTAMSANSKVVRNYTGVANALAIETNLSVDELKQLNDVVGVYPVRRYQKKLANALPIINAPDAWELVGGMEQAGQGIRVAVIDSGIIPDHPLFADNGIQAPAASTLPNDDYCRTTDASFCNNKLIVARYYMPSFVTPSFGEHESPQGLSGHGTHVAGIATGRQVTATGGEVISGVAPGAYLMAYKALWGQDGEGTDIELIAALEDAVEDGADIINNSWGGSNGVDPINSLYNSIFQQIEATGVLLVTAAGNEGEDLQGNIVPQSIACPGCVEAGITVGATTTDLAFGIPLTVGSDTYFAQPSDTFSLSSALSATATVAPADNTLGCSAWDEAITGTIAVINRGTCTFEQKADFAEQAGAVAMIIVNNVSGANITMSMGSANLPSVMITQAEGAELTATLAQSPATNISIAANQSLGSSEQSQDWLGTFSSLGPNGDDSFIKPDMVAPGVSILSGTSPEDIATLGDDYARFNGTSMATPMVAGAAAILKQENPSYNAIELKNILVNSSDAVVLDRAGERAATAFETGAGRLNITNALATNVYATSPNMAQKQCVVNCSIDNSLAFAGTGEAQTWTASVEFDNSAITGQVLPAQLVLSTAQPLQNFSVDVSVPAAMEEDWHFGRVRWTNDSGQVINQAIAVNNEQVNSALLQANVTDVDADTKMLTLNSQNLTSDPVLNVELQLTGGAEFVSSSLDVDNAGETNITTNTAQRIELDANVSSGNAVISSSSLPVTIDLTETNVEPFLCDFDGDDDGCDEVLIQYSFDFIHYGQQYSSLLLNDNGIVIAGNDLAQSNLSINESLPNAGVPNNVIAPFWTDFDLTNPNLVGDTGGGEFYVGLLEVLGRNYMILQWNKVKLWMDESQGRTPAYWGVSNEDVEFTFQLILEENSENKWFRYLDIPEQPNFYSVGLENQTGTAGSTYWFDGAGESQVDSGDGLSISFADLGQLQVQVDIDRTDNGSFSSDDEFTVSEDTATNLNLVSNDLASSDFANLQVDVAGVSYIEQLYEGEAGVTLDTSSLSITAQAENGQVTILNDGLVAYTPAANFSGNDSFSYSISNSAGDTSSSTVAVNVVAVDDAPEITSLTGPDSIAAGASATFNVTATDIDSDNLSYTWDVPGQLTVNNFSSNELTVSAPNNLTQNTQVTIEVDVTDGTTTVSSSISVTLLAAENTGGDNNTGSDGGSSGGGSLGFVILFMLAGLITLRRQPKLSAYRGKI